MTGLLERLNATAGSTNPPAEVNRSALLDRLNAYEPPVAIAPTAPITTTPGTTPSRDVVIEGPLLNTGTLEDVENSPLPTDLIIKGQEIVRMPFVRLSSTQNRIRSMRSRNANR